MSQIIETQLTSEQKATLRYVARLITKGSAGRIQVKGRYFKRIEDQDVKGCCAIGACLIAAGAPEENSLVLGDYLQMTEWPVINYPNDTPAWDRWNDAIYGKARLQKPMELSDVIMQLNDTAGWTFQRIAAYLRLTAQKGIVTSISA